MISLLKRTPVIWALFVVQILIGAGFGIFNDQVGGTYLDEITSGDQARSLVASLSEAQRTAHFWVTVCLDTAYPLAYGGFFAAMALRFLGRFGPLAALPALAVIIVDLTENMIQALALSGTADILGAKDWLTPLKFGLFFVAAAIALVALVIAIVNIFRKSKT